MRYVIFALTFAVSMAFVVSAPASARDAYRISTGSPSGTYFRVGLNAAGLVPGGAVDKSKGSIENLERLAEGTHTFAPVQLDAYAWWSDKYPAKAASVEILGPLYQECVYVAVNCDGKVGDEDDLEREGTTIAVGRQGSGGAVSWDYMRQLNPGYKKAAVVFQGGSRALGKLASSPNSGIDAVLWVTKPDIKHNKHLKSVMKNENLCMISLNDSGLNNVHKGLGRPIYEFEDVAIQKGWLNDKEVEIPCVAASMAANRDADEDLLNQMADIVLNYQNSLIK